MGGADQLVPFDAALRSAIRDRGLTLDRLRWHLDRRGIHIGLASLSDWQHGRSRPGSAKSLRAVQALEEILGLRRSALVTLLRRPLDAEPGTRRDGVDESAGPLADLLGSLPDTRGQLAGISRENRVLIDANGLASVVYGRSVMRALRDGVDRYLLRYFGAPGCDLTKVEFGRLENCRLGRVHRHPTEPVLVAELLFGESLAAGDTWVFGTEVRDETGEPCTDFGHGFQQSEEYYALELCFDPASQPVDCHVYARAALDGAPSRAQDLTLSTHRTVHVVAAGARSGVIGIAWDWA